ncbi:MAG: FKBP-type peptidyl-prolyl cis-trans isomerase [bacterium]
MKIEKGTRVRIQVVLKVVDGDVIEKSGLEYVHGGGTMLPGLEKALEGLEEGAEKKGVLPAKDAFGVEEDLPTSGLPRDRFPKDAKFEVGQIFTAAGAGGQDVNFKIIKLGKKDEPVEVRFLHPLTGKDIEYEAKVISVTDPIPPPMPGEAGGVELEEADD